MKCPRCGSDIADDLNYCTECGAPVGHQTDHQATVSPKKKSNVGMIVVIAVAVALVIIAIVAAVLIFSITKEAEKQLADFNQSYEEFNAKDISGDIDLDGLNKAVEDLENLDLAGDVDIDVDVPDVPDYSGGADASAQSTGGDLVKYSYTDVTTVGNDITVVPNGGLNGSTVLYGGKDLNGFLDFVDDKVLEEGRTINRQFFYDMLACMMVDKDLSSDTESIEKNMMMSLAVTNNFFGMDVKIASCELDADNAAEYHYKVTANGTDDTWIINYGKHEVYFNDGATEYSSDMFNDKYLATWLVAIDEYYGIQ